MTPRNPTSKNWTALPQEFREKAALVFAQNFKEETEHGQFFIEGRIYPSEIVMRAGFVEQGRLKQTNFEVSMEHTPSEKAMEKLFFGIDVLGSVFETHFEHLREDEADDVEYPVNWEEFDFDDEKVFLRFSTANTQIEAEANKLLGLDDGETLFVEGEADLSADALERATIDSELAAEVSKSIRDGSYKPNLTESQRENIEKHTEDLH
jgi:hypothetical protein